jgi:hypothetical protein
MDERTIHYSQDQNMTNRNPNSWSYFNGFRNPEIAKQLSYYTFSRKLAEKRPIEVLPANFTLFFGRVPQGYPRPLGFEDYEEGRLMVFYNVADAIKECQRVFGKDTGLYFYSYPGLDYISELENNAGSLRVLPGKNYLFPTCVATICEIADRLNIIKQSIYTCSPND